MKLIIAGSRNFNNYEMLSAQVRNFIGEYIVGKDLTIISGCADGADTLAIKFAEEYGIGIIKIPADWELHGKSAGYLRNVEMAKIATHCIVFWDGESKGSKHMIDIAKKYNLITKIVK